MIPGRLMLILLSLFSLSLIDMTGQEITNATRRKMNLAALNVLDDYQLVSAINSKSDRYRFIQLFDSPDAKVFCDLFNTGGAFKSEITVQEYAELLMNKCENINAEISQVRKESVYLAPDSMWHCTVVMDKSLTYNDMNGVLFPPFVDDVTPFKLEVDLVYDENEDRMRIHRISCLNSDHFKPMNDFYIVQRNKEKSDSLRDTQVSIDRKLLEFNSFGQAYSEKGKLEYWDYDVNVDKKMIAEDDSYEMVILNYKRKRFRMKAHYGMTLNSRYEVQSKTVFDNNQSTGQEAGLDLGFSFSASRGFRFGIFTGATASFSTIDFEKNNMSYSYQSSDKDGSMFTRSYDVRSAAQNVKFMDVAVPLYFSLNFRLARGASLFFDLGGRAYFNLLSEVSPMTISGTVKSTSQSQPVNETFNVSTNEFLSSKAFERENMDFSVFGKAGLEICLLRNSMYLLASAGYEHGLTWSYKSDENPFYSDTVFPYVYNAQYGKDVAFRPFADCVSFKRKCVWLNFGLMLKL